MFQSTDMAQVAQEINTGAKIFPGVEDDPFDLEALRVTNEDTIGAEKVLLKVPVRKPGRQEFFRVHRDPAYSADIALLELKEDREYYLVARTLWDLLPDDLIKVRLMTCMTRSNVLFLWPAKLPNDDRRNAWTDTALEISERAKTDWCRMTSNMSLGSYELSVASGAIPEPNWPDKTFRQLIDIAFKQNQISDENHFVLRKLAGAV